MALDPTLLRRRLAFIRYIYRTAQEQSALPDPTCAVALLSMHDAVDMFLYLAVEHLDLPDARKTDLMAIWGTIDGRLDELGKPKLTHRAAVNRLNKARVELKHRGTRPSKSDILEFQTTVHAVLGENALTLFEVEFASVSLVDLIFDDAVRELLARAVELMSESDYNNAMKNIALAFDELVANHRPTLGTGSRRSRFTPRIEGLPDKSERVVKDLYEDVRRLEAFVQLLGLGVDYRRYALFTKRSPRVRRTFGGTVSVGEAFRGSVPEAKMHDVTNYCLNFVIDTALTLESFDDPLARSPEAPPGPRDADDSDENGE